MMVETRRNLTVVAPDRRTERRVEFFRCASPWCHAFVDRWGQRCPTCQRQLDEELREVGRG